VGFCYLLVWWLGWLYKLLLLSVVSLQLFLVCWASVGWLFLGVFLLIVSSGPGLCLGGLGRVSDSDHVRTGGSNGGPVWWGRGWVGRAQLGPGWGWLVWVVAV